VTLPEWALKRGDDFTAPQAIVVKVDTVAQDLTDADWTYAAQARLRSDDATVVDFDIDPDTALLEDGKLVLSLPRATTEDMEVGGWVIDVEATNDTIDGVGRKSSATFTLTVKNDVTREPAP
jgi:hypothetical protein